MIINHKYKFCYFAIPRTGSKALSKALIDELGSESYLRMHASYQEFKEQSPKEYHGYTRLTTIRNPLDSIVSSYFKKKSDHNGRFSRGTYRLGKPIAENALKEYQFILENKATFSEYLCEFFSQSVYEKKRLNDTVDACDFVLKYESLQDDFDKFLATMRLDSISIPLVNKTKLKSKHYVEYYDKEAQKVALKSFKNIMNTWNYSFPKEWLDPI